MCVAAHKQLNFDLKSVRFNKIFAPVRFYLELDTSLLSRSQMWTLEMWNLNRITFYEKRTHNIFEFVCHFDYKMQSVCTMIFQHLTTPSWSEVASQYIEYGALHGRNKDISTSKFSRPSNNSIACISLFDRQQTTTTQEEFISLYWWTSQLDIDKFRICDHAHNLKPRATLCDIAYGKNKQ